MPPAVALAEPATAPANRRAPDPAPKFEYQPALDGLRALAVLGVLLYHAGVSWAPGGFLGVDAFFVLSGFLITSLLVDEWQKRGRIDFRAFWARRARRLLPALVLVVIAVGAYALFVARPEELERIRGDTFGSLLYVANWRQLFESSYFAQLSTPSPLRHTWSRGWRSQRSSPRPLGRTRRSSDPYSRSLRSEPSGGSRTACTCGTGRSTCI